MIGEGSWCVAEVADVSIEVVEAMLLPLVSRLTTAFPTERKWQYV